MTIPAPHTLGTIALSAIAGISIASVCGLRAFLPLLALALGAHLGWIALDPRAAWLGSDAALWALVAATLVELAADKVPGLDHLLDVVATFVRPVAAAFAAWATVAGVLLPLLALAIVVLGGAWLVRVATGRRRA